MTREMSDGSGASSQAEPICRGPTNVGLAAILVVAFLLLSVTTALVWTETGKYAVSGDEPHYLVMADGVGKYGSLEQSKPYDDELRSREIFKPGIGGPTHALEGPNGLYNVHAPGLGVLLAFPYLVGGALAAKVFLIFIGSISVVLAWKVSSLYSQDRLVRVAAVAAISFAPCLIVGSAQVYPDVTVGVLALAGLYFLMTIRRPRSSFSELMWLAAISLMPWFQIKNAAAMMVIIISCLVAVWARDRNPMRLVIYALVPAFSLTALGLYNLYAFGNPLGPYEKNALVINPTAVMTFIGLHIDQDQGFLLQNPILLLGIPAIGVLFRQRFWFGVAWLLTFLALIAPNALHPNWYGGYSIAGRFAWSATIVFVVPAMMGLCSLAKFKLEIFLPVAIAGCILQLVLYWHYTWDWSGEYLYGRQDAYWPDLYAMFYPSIRAFLPMLYDVNWAHSFLPNYIWFAFASALFIFGFFAPHLKSGAALAAAMLILALGCAGIASSALFPITMVGRLEMDANTLPSQTGKIVGSTIVATSGTDQPGFVSFGPYTRLSAGKYRIVVRYKSAAPSGEVVGYFDILDADAASVLEKVDLVGTEGRDVISTSEFAFRENDRHRFEFRTNWNGEEDFTLFSIVVEAF